MAIFELSNGKANLVWLSTAIHATNLQELKDAVEAGKLPNEIGKSML